MFARVICSREISRRAIRPQVKPYRVHLRGRFFRKWMLIEAARPFCRLSTAPWLNSALVQGRLPAAPQTQQAQKHSNSTSNRTSHNELLQAGNPKTPETPLHSSPCPFQRQVLQEVAADGGSQAVLQAVHSSFIHDDRQQHHKHTNPAVDACWDICRRSVEQLQREEDQSDTAGRSNEKRVSASICAMLLWRVLQHRWQQHMHGNVAPAVVICSSSQAGPQCCSVQCSLPQSH